MAVLGERLSSGHRGKPSYMAPEMAITPLVFYVYLYVKINININI